MIYGWYDKGKHKAVFKKDFPTYIEFNLVYHIKGPLGPEHEHAI